MRRDLSIDYSIDDAQKALAREDGVHLREGSQGIFCLPTFKVL